MGLTERMNQFRLASRDLYNQYFYSESRDQAIEAEERHSNLLEYLFQYMVLEPEDIRDVEYFESNDKIVVTLKDRDNGFYLVKVEVSPGNWKQVRVHYQAEPPKMYFENYFDWDELGIKDNQFVEGRIFSFPGNESLVGKTGHFDAREAIFEKA